MGFMDELKRLAHPYEDEDEDDFEEFEPAPRAAVPERRDRSERMDRTGSLYSAPVGAGAPQQQGRQYSHHYSAPGGAGKARAL